LPMPLGSMPHLNVNEAWELTLRHFPEIPAWPQLPGRSFLENMYTQFSEGFPGIVLQNDRIFVDRSLDLDSAVEELCIRYLADDVEAFGMRAEYAAGLWKTKEALRDHSPIAIKGQVTGPVSWGLMVVDQDRRPVLYDDLLGDLIPRHLRMKAAWQESFLRQFADQTIIMVDEPYMSSFGSAFVAVDRPLVLQLLEETFAGISGLSGIHCCGNTDWGLLLTTSVNILSLDAYQYAETLALYPEELGAFLARGGMIAWGIVPNGSELETETADSLLDRFEKAVLALEARGIGREQVLERGFITPSCGTGRLSPAFADRVLTMTRRVSLLARERYLGIPAASSVSTTLAGT
jgi:hypothetical protein